MLQAGESEVGLASLRTGMDGGLICYDVPDMMT